MRHTRDTTYSYPVRMIRAPRPVWKRVRDLFVTVPYILRRTLFPQQPRWYSITVICITLVILGAMTVSVILK